MPSGKVKMKVRKQIIIDCERMKYANTGLYHYCLQLCQALQRNIDKENEELKLYVRAATAPAFGPGFSFIYQHTLHKFFMPLKKSFNVWHSTYQGTQYFPFRKRKGVVFTVHDLNFLYDEHKTEIKKQKYLRQHARKINAADHIVAISNFVLEDVRRHFDVSRKPCSVIYNGCNIPAALSGDLPGFKKPESPFLYTIGTVVDKKNFHVLPSLLVNNNRLLLISGIIQSEAYKEKIIAEARKHKVEDRVIFTGPVTENEKSWYLQHCEIFLFPSLAEGFGLPVIEAMYFGRPVILSTHTSLPEIGGEEAYYFKNFEPVNMRQTLEESLQHYNSTNAREKIIARARSFNWDNAAKQYLEIYRTLY
jgi:glycosyltransferase involved in cell wall biosynthesis